MTSSSAGESIGEAEGEERECAEEGAGDSGGSGECELAADAMEMADARCSGDALSEEVTRVAANPDDGVRGAVADSGGCAVKASGREALAAQLVATESEACGVESAASAPAGSSSPPLDPSTTRVRLRVAFGEGGM